MQLVLKILAALFITVVVALVIYLLPAHLEVRDNQTALPSLSNIKQVASSDDLPIQVSYILTSSQSIPGGTTGHHSIVIEWQDGRSFLIDTGMDAGAAIEFGSLLETMWGADPVAVKTTTQEALANKQRQASGVGLTHLHIDHSQGLEALCAALTNLMLFQTAVQHNVHNMHTTEGAELAANCRKTEIGGDVLTPVPGFTGLAMYNLGGHTPGSTLFVVSTLDETYLFSGDTTNSKADIDNNTPKPWWYSYLIVPEDTNRTAQLREWLKEIDTQQGYTVVVSHDVDKTAEQLPEF